MSAKKRYFKETGLVGWRTSRMGIYGFTVKLNVDEFKDGMADQLHKAGCTDCLVWRSEGGGSGVHLTFTRPTSSRFITLLSTVRAIKRAGYRVIKYYDYPLVVGSWS